MRESRVHAGRFRIENSASEFDRVSASRNLPSRLAREGSVRTETSNASRSDGAATIVQAAC
jgi:hypothetical protein